MVGSPCSPRDSQESSPTPQFESINSLVPNLFYGPTLHPYMTTGKTIALTTWTFVGKLISLFLIQFRFVIKKKKEKKLLTKKRKNSNIVYRRHEGVL